MQGLLDVVSPALSKVLESNIAASITSLKKLPGLLGFLQTGEAEPQTHCWGAYLTSMLGVGLRCFMRPESVALFGKLTGRRLCWPHKPTERPQASSKCFDSLAL